MALKEILCVSDKFAVKSITLGGLSVYLENRAEGQPQKITFLNPQSGEVLATVDKGPKAEVLMMLLKQLDND